MIRRTLAAGLILCATPVRGWALQTTAAGQGPWIPIDQLPPTDQMPAAPLLIAAYGFVWVATMVYLWTIWRRLGKVEDDMRALQRRGAERSGRR